MLFHGGNGVGGCNDGAHTASRQVPFGLTVGGYDIAVSYGYPARMAVETVPWAATRAS